MFTLVAYIILSFALIQCRTTWSFSELATFSSEFAGEADRELAEVKRVARWTLCHLPTLSRCVAVSVNCEESYEYSAGTTGRAKREAWVQIEVGAGTLPHCAMARRERRAGR